MNLKARIVAAGKSQRQIADVCRIPENRFSDIVRGRRKPREAEREAIAAALGRPADELFDQKDDVHTSDAVVEPTPA